MNNSNNPFDIEKLRSQFAIKGKLKELAKLYKTRYAEIPNVNTSDLWDKLNIKNQNKLNESPIFRDKIRIITSQLHKEEGNVLDIGIGIGYLEKRLFSNRTKLSLYGTDISIKSLDYVKRNMPRVVVKESNLEKLPFKSNFFDVVIALDILEHISPHKVFKVYKEIGRVLKKGGRLLISVPINEGLETMIEKGFNPNAHVRVYTESLLVSELKLAKFRVIECYNLFAFRDFYFLKSILARYIFKSTKLPNLLILKAIK